MRITQVSKDIVTDGAHTYLVGFINNEHNEDETEFDVSDLQELIEVWNDFCKENGVMLDAVTYIEHVI